MSAHSPRSGQAAGKGIDERIACQVCHAGNRPHRGYCRECGAALAPVCRGCRFVNDRGDQFCGGCGSMLVELPAAAAGDAAVIRSAPPAGPAPKSAAATAKPARGPDAGALLRGDAELAALLAPIAAAAPKDELPQANITQDDLDRLFGGTS